MEKGIEQEAFGPNIWLVDEMYRRYLENPQAVGPSWREFFEDYQPHGGDGARVAAPRPAEVPAPPPSPAAEKQAPPRPAAEPAAVPEDASPLRGASARIAENMAASLQVPTATSARSIPAKLLEENRRIINRYLAATRGGKVSFTHLIGYAILRALEARPAMKASYLEAGGAPHVLHPKHVNFGLAVDLERSGGRVLVVPNIKRADELDFAAFFSAYEELIRRTRANELQPEDFAGTTVTLTNPGTVGTSLSVPRLMQGQGLIVGTGAIGYSSEYEAADPRVLARVGVSKLITITSTYDHRVIQGAESGEFLSYIHKLLLGEERFYDAIFASLKVPYEPVRWSRDRAPLDGADSELEKQSRVIRLINMFRVRGHLLAELNPIGWEVLSYRELDLSYYGLTVWDLDREFLAEGLPGPRKQTLRQILDTLRDAYCRRTGYEYMHISDPDEKGWIQERVEAPGDEIPIEDKRHVLERLNAAESFERFLHSKYVGHKRFSLEGAESVIPMLDALLEEAADNGIIEVVMGMAHRGRLNVLSNIIGKPLGQIFREFQGDIDPYSVQGSGDVKYHLGMTGRFASRNGNSIAVVLASNPSHLESVNPVVEGMARAKQGLIGPSGHKIVMPLLIHGDAAFAGQGVVAETLNLSQLSGYRSGGTVHLVINNNIGFTTTPTAGRSSIYATDVAKMVQAPIIHVNGDEPEACVRAIKLAFAYRQAFHKDVVVDMVCYRRHGHNEADEPAFTQPLMYAKIEQRRSVRKLYTEQLLNRGEISVEEAEQFLENFQQRLHQAFEETRGSTASESPEPESPQPGVVPSPPIETGVERERLDAIHRVLTSPPEGFEPHPKLKRQMERRAEMLAKDAIDWAGGEALALGSMLLEGFRIRLCGQDTRRGTFSQRHSVLVDHRSGEEYTPLQHLGPEQAPFRAFDSLLSEFAAMGFEYGYSVANGDALVLWEAQFGDFANGAQVVIDQFIVAGETKWGQQSGVVLLLPHGYEGQGPEHSSARIERFLALCAEANMYVCQPTSAAQYFHLLRRQMHRSIRRPLVVFTPKSLLRHPAARSATADLERGRFVELLDDPGVEDLDRVRRVLLCSGKVAYDLMAARDENNHPSAVVRLEQLYPLEVDSFRATLQRYPNAEELRWVQEEPENMGAWRFVRHHLLTEVPSDLPYSLVSRAESASPATGSAHRHEKEQRALVERAFADHY